MTKARYKKRKDGRYATTVMVGYKEDGRPDNVFLSAKTEKALRNKVLELKMKMKSGKLAKQSGTLLKDYADSWLETYKASASINTKAMYANALKRHIKPELGTSRLTRSSGQTCKS